MHLKNVEINTGRIELHSPLHQLIKSSHAIMPFNQMPWTDAFVFIPLMDRSMQPLLF